MYLKNKNSFFHGIMFHHFHDNNGHLKGQGSISKDDFIKIINFIGRENILDADEFLIRFKEKRLSKKDVCLTFDDALKCQFDIAVPVLNEMNIKAYFFIYSSIFTGSPDMLEIYRHFRMNYFDSVNNFYRDFFNFFSNIKKEELNTFFNLKKNNIKTWKKKFPYYSINDIKFRFVRDELLTNDEYKNIMFGMMKSKNFNYKKIIKNLFLSKHDLRKMHKSGHLIGLHSHSHPTKLEKLNYTNQLKEYTLCLKMISNILGKKYISSMSHPCGSYNYNTLKILKKLKLEIGFKQIMTKDKNMKKINNSNYELARQDHSNIMKMMQK